LRNSEVCGLKWEDLDFETGTLKVRHAVVSSNGKVREKVTKTPASRRDIPLDAELARRLKRWASRVFDNEPQQLRGFYVLGTEDGQFYQPSTLRWQFTSFVETNEIVGTTGKPPTFYALRHTFATMLLQAGVDAKTVASLMGHTSVSMTLDVYACTDPKAKAAAGAVLSQVIAER
jgi:integrase